MARIKFLGFDLQGNGTPTSVNANHDFVACDSGTEFVAPDSDSTFYAYNTGGMPIRCGQGYPTPGGVGLGKNGISNSPLSSNGFSPSACFSVTMLKSAINNLSDVFCSFDLFMTAPGNNFFNVTLPSTWAQTASRWQVFKYGDLTLRLTSITGNGSPVPGYYNVVFTGYNGPTSVFTITLTDKYLLSGYAPHVRIRAKLASGTDGAFDASVGGVSGSATSINSVAVTPFASVDRIWFSGGGLQEPSPGNFSYGGSIDNIMIDDAALQGGRPLVAVVSSGFADVTLSNWTFTNAGTMSEAVQSVDTKRAEGQDAGARMELDIPAPTMTTWNTNLLGYQVVPGLLTKLTAGTNRKAKTGVSVSGTDTFADQVRSVVLPDSPTRVDNCGTDSMFYNSSGGSFTKATVANTNVVVEVI